MVRTGEWGTTSSDLFRRCGLNLEGIPITSFKTTGMPDGKVLLEAGDHYFSWLVAVSPDNGRAWRAQGFEESDLRELVQSRREHFPDDRTALRLQTAAFSGPSGCSLALWLRALMWGVFRELLSTCGKAPPDDAGLKLIPS